jgi:hypothetical protein
MGRIFIPEVVMSTSRVVLYGMDLKGEKNLRLHLERLRSMSKSFPL